MMLLFVAISTQAQDKKNKTPNCMSIKPLLKGKHPQTNIASKNPKKGLTQNKLMLERRGNESSLENNLTASEKGCKTPIIPSLFGPLRICVYLKTLRSNKVRKATEIKTNKKT